MNRTATYSLFLIVLTGLLVWLLRANSNDPQSSSSGTENGTKNTRVSNSSDAVIKSSNPLTAFLNAFKFPIELYGKIIDQHGHPVTGATVRVSPVDGPFGDQSNSAMAIVSDTFGKFSVKGKKGYAMGVSSRKEGYMTLPPLGGPTSSAMVGYGGGQNDGKKYSNPATPLILTLHKIGPVEPMVYIDNMRWKLAVNGTVSKIALDSKIGEGAHQIEFQFKSNWNRLPKTNEMYGKLFDWSFVATIPGGGFIKNDSDYNFEAPEGGYQETIVFEYPATMPQETWKSFKYGRYFVKFADGTYGRIHFEIFGSSDPGPLSLTSWLNLKPGSRNLSSNGWDPTRVSE